MRGKILVWGEGSSRTTLALRTTIKFPFFASQFYSQSALEFTRKRNLLAGFCGEHSATQWSATPE